jgi:hypothetical protein
MASQEQPTNTPQDAIRRTGGAEGCTRSATRPGAAAL